MDTLLEAISKLIPPEIIDGTDVREAAKMVMPEVAISPVVPHMVVDRLDMRVPATETVVACEGGVLAVKNDRGILQRHSIDEIKVMRARYLLVRGWYYKNLETLSPHTRDLVLSRFFKGGVFKPKILESRE